MGYITGFLLLGIATLLGKAVVAFLNLKKTKHTLVYGFFTYFSGFFILSGPFTFLHLHWNLYFVVMTGYNIVVLWFIFYVWSKKKMTIDWRGKTLIQYVKDNYLPLLMVVFFMLMNVASNNVVAGGAVGDDVYYLSWAAKNIGHTIRPLSVNLVTGEASGMDFQALISFLELFWAYMHKALAIDLVLFVRTTMSIVTYVWFFFAVDEVLYVMLQRQHYERFKYTILTAGLLYYVSGMQSEVYKFMYNPWFGNVFSLMIYTPLLLLFFFQSLTHKKALYLLLLLPLTSSGFSPVSLLHVGLSAFVFTCLWYQHKTYRMRYEKQVLALSFFVSCLFLFVSSVPNWSDIVLVLQEPAQRASILDVAEFVYFKEAFVDRLLFLLVGVLIFFYRLARKEVTKLEAKLFLFFFLLLFVALLPGIDKALFVAFSFPYRRVLDSYMLVLVFYSGAMLLTAVREVSWRQLLGIFAVCSFMFYQTSGFYFVDDVLFKQHFNPRHVLKEKRLAPVVSKLEAFLLVAVGEKTNVCTFDGREVPYNNGKYRIDLGLAIAPVPNAYFSCAQPQNSNEQLYYVVVNKNDLVANVGATHVEFVTAIATDDLTLEVYRYVAA